MLYQIPEELFLVQLAVDLHSDWGSLSKGWFQGGMKIVYAGVVWGCTAWEAEMP